MESALLFDSCCFFVRQTKSRPSKSAALRPPAIAGVDDDEDAGVGTGVIGGVGVGPGVGTGVGAGMGEGVGFGVALHAELHAACVCVPLASAAHLPIVLLQLYITGLHVALQSTAVWLPSGSSAQVPWRGMPSVDLQL